MNTLKHMFKCIIQTITYLILFMAILSYENVTKIERKSASLCYMNVLPLECSRYISFFLLSIIDLCDKIIY